MQETPLQVKEDYQKTFKKFFFSFAPNSFYRQNYEKQKGSGTSYESLFGLKNMLIKIPLLFIYYLGNFDNLARSCFWVIPEISLLIYASQCRRHHYFTFISPFEFGNYEKERKNYKELNVRKQKDLLSEIKSIFHNVWNAVFWWNICKIQDTSFKNTFFIEQLPLLLL